ncbi:MAG: GGDEF domain-containing protein, partial [Methylomonas sp.]|nr:GGDEF domain-containing protein [Methylomonas sp.]
MKTNTRTQQIFAWLDRLTIQPDYHALTHEFLNLLQQMPNVERATAFEVYGGRNRKACESCSVCEHMVRRFPIDLSDETEDEYEEMLKDFVTSGQDLVANHRDENGLVTRVVAVIHEVVGPNRALLLEGKFDQQTMEMFVSLIKVYQNLVALHDSKERDTLTKLP